MTVPVQRGAGSNEDSTVLNLVLDGVREVKDGMVRLQNELSRAIEGLDGKYVRLNEFKGHTEESLRDRGQLRELLIAERAEREKLEERLIASRRWVFTAAAMALTGVVGVIGLILTIIVNFGH